MTGVVKTINSERGYLFVTADEGKEDYFAHRSSCENFDGLSRGQSVIFDTEPSPRGPRATNLRAAGKPPEVALQEEG